MRCNRFLFTSPARYFNILNISGLYSKESAEHVQQLLQKNEVPPNLFELYVEEIFSYLRGNIFKRFIESDKFTRKENILQTSCLT